MAVGAPHPDHLADVLTPRQVNEWITYFEKYPPLNETAPVHLAGIQAMIAAAFGGKKQDVLASTYLAGARGDITQPNVPANEKRRSLKASMLRLIGKK